MRSWLRKHMPDHAAVSDNRWLAPFRSTLLHPRLWHLNRRSAAGAVAAGLFCGLIPGPFQMLGAAICAVAFRINLPVALLTTLYTNPFTIIPLYIAAFAVGKLVVGGETKFVPPTDFTLDGLVAWLGQLGLPLFVGLALLASFLAAAGYLAVRIAWRLYLLKKLMRRKSKFAKK